MEKDSKIYDYAIIGAGAAGLHLSLAMLADNWFTNKSILILDKDNKTANDKTWSFWEKGAGRWDGIIEKSWAKGKFNTKKESIDLDLAPYLYKTLPSINFYEFGKKNIAKANNIEWIKAEVKAVNNRRDKIEIASDQSTYFAKQVFDSRIDKGFELADKQHFTLQQHFKGWIHLVYRRFNCL